MRCISPMEYQSTALSVHWYQSYHWYQWTGGIPSYSYLIHCENILSPLDEMYFTNGIPIDCLVSPLVPIVPLVPMDDRNHPVLLPDSDFSSVVLRKLDGWRLYQFCFSSRDKELKFSICGYCLVHL